MAALFVAVSPAPPATPSVHVRDFAYAPSALVVTAGTIVRFVNDDDEAHTVTAVDRYFDSAGMDTGAAWSHRFVKPGTYAYFCALHPYMHGTVVVRAAEAKPR